VDAIITTGRKIMGRLPMGSDLLKSLVKICREKDIKLGEVRGIGALAHTRLAYFDQTTRMYETLEFEHDMEISSMLGNISLQGTKPIVHVRLIMADEKGRSFGGQLVPGCEVYGLEYVIEEYKSEARFERSFDEETGLMLWNPNLLG
jgi:uncharacterized protein